MSRTRSPLVICGAVLFVMLFSMGIRSVNIPAYLESKANIFMGEPLLTTPDAYYYNRLAQEVADGDYDTAPQLRPVARPGTPPLLSKVAGVLSFATDSGKNVRSIAFYFPVICSSFIGILLFFWGRQWRGQWAGIGAAVFAALVPIWIQRSTPGYFDTDCLNLFFFWFIAYCFWKATFLRYSPLWLAAAALTMACFYFWWPQAAVPYTGLAVLCVAPCFVFKAPRPWLTSGILLGLGVVGLVLATNDLLPAFLQKYWSSFEQHVSFLSGENSSIYLSVSSTVMELTKSSFTELAAGAAGHWGVYLTAAIGLGYFAFRQPGAGSLFIVAMAFSLVMAQYFGSRFQMFAGPAAAAGIVWFCMGLHDLLYRLLPKKKITAALTVMIFAALCWPAFQKDYEYRLGSILDRNQAVMANALGKVSTPKAMVWSQWGPAYFIQNFSKRRTWIDGGYQDPEHVYLAAVPFAIPDPNLAADWMRLFTKRGDILPGLTRYTKSRAYAVKFLLQALSNPDSIPALLKHYNLPNDRDWKKWLFPEDAEAYLYLSSDTLIRATWLTQGLVNLETGEVPETAQVYALASAQCRVEKKKGIVQFREQKVNAKAFYYVTPKSLSHKNYRKKGPIILFVQGDPTHYLIPGDSWNALAFQLLFVHPDSTPRFKKIIYNPYVGGVWKIN